MASDINNLADGSYVDIAVENGIYITETAGREGNDSAGSATAERTFLLRGSSDPLVCREALINGPVLIDVYDGLFLDSISRVRMGPDQWEFTCTYNNLNPQPGDFTVSVDTTGGQILQTYAYGQNSFAAPGKTLPDFGNAIDVQNGEPQGVERVIPVLKINVQTRIHSDYITSPVAYSRILAQYTGWTNSLAYKGFDANELLFIGASGDVIANDHPMLTFSFLAGENLVSQTIGSITGINKKAHEYLWYYYAPAKDATTGVKTADIEGAYVGQIYGERDFAPLQIGETP